MQIYPSPLKDHEPGNVNCARCQRFRQWEPSFHPFVHQDCKGLIHREMISEGEGRREINECDYCGESL